MSKREGGLEQGSGSGRPGPMYFEENAYSLLIFWGAEVKASASNAGDRGSIPGSGRSPGEGNGNSLQYSCLENPMTEEPGRLQSTGSQRVRHD